MKKRDREMCKVETQRRGRYVTIMLDLSRYEIGAN